MIHKRKKQFKTNIEKEETPRERILRKNFPKALISSEPIFIDSKRYDLIGKRGFKMVKPINCNQCGGHFTGGWRYRLSKKTIFLCDRCRGNYRSLYVTFLSNAVDSNRQKH